MDSCYHCDIDGRESTCRGDHSDDDDYNLFAQFVIGLVGLRLDCTHLRLPLFPAL